MSKIKIKKDYKNCIYCSPFSLNEKKETKSRCYSKKAITKAYGYELGLK